MLTVRYFGKVGSLSGKGAPGAQGSRHLQHLLRRFFACSRPERPEGSLPACASGNVEPRIRLITRRHSLSPSSFPRSAIGSPYGVPASKEERYGLTVFRVTDHDGLGALCSPVAMLSMPEKASVSGPCYSPFLGQAYQHLWLVRSHGVYREFASAHHTINPRSFPPDAGRDTVPSRFRCYPIGYRSIVRGLSTARYLAAVPRRVRLMEQPVWSELPPDNHTRDFTSQPAINGEDSRETRFLLHSDEAPQASRPQCPWVGVLSSGEDEPSRQIKPFSGPMVARRG